MTTDAGNAAVAVVVTWNPGSADAATARYEFDTRAEGEAFVLGAETALGGREFDVEMVPADTPVTEAALRDSARAALDRGQAGEAGLVFDEPDCSAADHANSRIVEVYAEDGDGKATRFIAEEIQLKDESESVKKLRAHRALRAWLDRVESACHALGSEPLEFRTWTKEAPELSKFNGQKVALIAPIIEPSEEFDEEALPYFRVRAESGEEFVAEGCELFSQDPRWLELYSAACGGYGVARTLREDESIVGPFHLVADFFGETALISEFEKDAAEIRFTNLGQHWNTPQEFIVAEVDDDGGFSMSKAGPCA